LKRFLFIYFLFEKACGTAAGGSLITRSWYCLPFVRHPDLQNGTPSAAARALFVRMVLQ
jgi:hypothetical protein